MHVLGRDDGPAVGPTARLGSFLARDGSDGGPVALDCDRPHAAVVVGKRGSGKSHTLGVLAEELADADGVTPVLIDPMGEFDGLAALPDATVREPRVRSAALPPPAWPELVGLDPNGAPGSLVWRVVAEAGAQSPSITGLRDRVRAADVPAATIRAADNALALAATWGVFDADAPSPAGLSAGGPTVLDCSSLSRQAVGAVARVVARGLYESRIDTSGASHDDAGADVGRPLPWLLVDEAHVLFDGVAAPALRTLLTRGRSPGVSLVCATQRPSALPDVAVSQSDLIVAHRLTAERDRDALRAAQPSFLGTDVGDAVPSGVGEALVVDDATERAHTVTVRDRETPHGGTTPRASQCGRNSATRRDRDPPTRRGPSNIES